MLAELCSCMQVGMCSGELVVRAGVTGRRMIPSLLLQARLGHQELEQGVGRVVKLLACETKTHKQKLIQQHKVLKQVQSMQKTSQVRTRAAIIQFECLRGQAVAPASPSLFAFHIFIRFLRVCEVCYSVCRAEQTISKIVDEASVSRTIRIVICCQANDCADLVLRDC